MDKQPHLLIVDDRRDIREPLKRYLESHGFHLTLAEDAANARQAMEASRFDLIVLDIMMPGEDGLSLCRHIQSTTNTPVIFLTAMDEETDRIVGLELGADDYMVKPFNPRELMARIKAVLRRSTAEHIPQDEEGPDEISHWLFGDWQLDSATRCLEHANGEEISLSSGEYDLFVVLLNRPNRVLNRDQLLELTQGRSADAYDRAIDNQISRLRKKMKKVAKDKDHIIQTVWGSGYKLVAKVVKSR